MARIITVSREFGSGGRELGKRLADELGFEYYDREIIDKVAEESQLDTGYVESVLNGNFSLSFPVTFGRTFFYSDSLQQNITELLVAEQKIIKTLAEKKTDMVIVGRSADALLKDYKPFNIFVYADMESKMKRCRWRAPANEQLTDRELARKIKQVDTGRKRQRKLITDIPWGKKESYHLCINTTGVNIKNLVPPLAELIKSYF
ncbi:MAG: cytidylate kinase-like family protein [Acutalibacteraceae bacterium]|nr:cytidylate kinase-like family protein [Acutalibacteraceae bacterium]